MRCNLVCKNGLTALGIALLGFVAVPCVVPHLCLAKDEAGAAAAEAQEAPAAIKPFHQLHVDDLGIDCTACHAADGDTPAGDNSVRLSKRPYHTACEDCHDQVGTAEDFDSPYCKVCHTGPAEVESFPSGKVDLGPFSHATHVDPQGRINKETGVRQDCAFCHPPSASAVGLSPSGHPECASCHAGANAVSPKIDLAGDSQTCQGCHSLTRIEELLTARRLGQERSAYQEWETGRGRKYLDIVAFPHGKHRQRLDGAPIDCVTCHAAVLIQTDVTSGSAVPAMTDCQKCHDNANFVDGHALTKNCSVCHTTLKADTLPSPREPVSRDLVHNPSFRRFHNVVAERDDAVCGSCHRDVLNVGVDKCAGCHSSMQPKSHLQGRWNEQWHGRQVAFDRMQCTACHTADFCTKCHDSVMPRSHTPLASFRAGGHRQAAALNLRSCFTCHTFEPLCAECHDQQLQP